VLPWIDGVKSEVVGFKVGTISTTNAPLFPNNAVDGDDVVNNSLRIRVGEMSRSRC
jgi:hypothetical protein